MKLARKFLVPLNLSPLPSDPSNGSDGDMYFNYLSNIVRVFYDDAWHDISSASGGATYSFTTVATPDSQQIFADSSSDTINLTQSNGVVITSNAVSDTVNISTNSTPLNTASTIVSRDSSQSFDITGIDFDTTDTISSQVGRLNWDDGEGTLSLGLKGGNINLPVGQEEVALCYNGTGSILNKGTVVYISGAQGQRPAISRASASLEATSSKTFGIVAENISSGSEGFVTTFGIVKGINTSLFTEGGSLWLSTVSGLITQSMPTAPNHAVFIGYCIKSHSSSGEIFVKIQNGYEIDELHNVLISSIQDNHILSYDSTLGYWKNQSLLDAIKEVDGPGSGIDADLLDGQNSTWYQSRSNHTGTQPHTTISDWQEAVEDTVSNQFIHSQHLNITAVYDDLTGRVILTGSGGGSGGGGGDLATSYWLGV